MVVQNPIWAKGGTYSLAAITALKIWPYTKTGYPDRSVSFITVTSVLHFTVHAGALFLIDGKGRMRLTLVIRLDARFSNPRLSLDEEE